MTGPMPPPGPPRPPMDITRMASAAVLVSGLVVLFSSLFDLYSVEVSPGAVEDSVSGKVNVGIGFYTVVPFNAPVVALALPILGLIAALTALPGVLGRRQATLVSAVSAIAATLLGFVLMVSNPLPDVELTGDLKREAGDELKKLGISSVDELVDRVVDIGPGTGLILSLVFSVLAAAAAVVVYLRSPAGDRPPVIVGPGPTPPQVPMGPTSVGFPQAPPAQQAHWAAMPAVPAPGPLPDHAPGPMMPGPGGHMGTP
ncbi:hypothetical protein [Gordonia spumicola]|uniref:hypothetical protein n=1 Tax=Gordonia spumicola TaxID=589161 RepID=UPI00137A2BBD|nr:hypothetical protein [Gordonia spumicola]